MPSRRVAEAAPGNLVPACRSSGVLLPPEVPAFGRVPETLRPEPAREPVAEFPANVRADGGEPFRAGLEKGDAALWRRMLANFRQIAYRNCKLSLFFGCTDRSEAGRDPFCNHTVTELIRFPDLTHPRMSCPVCTRSASS